MRLRHPPRVIDSRPAAGTGSLEEALGFRRRSTRMFVRGASRAAMFAVR